MANRAPERAVAALGAISRALIRHILLLAWRLEGIDTSACRRIHAD
jgi:hypothetical protein